MKELHHPLDDFLSLILVYTQRSASQRAALIKNGLPLIEGRYAILLKEQSRIDRIAPYHSFLTGGFPVGGVVALILEFLDALLEKWVIIIFIEGDTGAENIDQ